MFSVPPAELKRQAAGHVVLDQMLQDRAVARGTPVFDLEDVEEQIAVFAGLSERDQIEMFKSTLRLNPQINEIFGDDETGLSKRRSGSVALYWARGCLSAGTDTRLMDLFNRQLIETAQRSHG